MHRTTLGVMCHIKGHVIYCIYSPSDPVRTYIHSDPSSVSQLIPSKNTGFLEYVIDKFECTALTGKRGGPGPDGLLQVRRVDVLAPHAILPPDHQAPLRLARDPPATSEDRAQHPIVWSA